VMGVQDRATLERACDLGLAFQLTNIARDIVDDATVGRCYLPATWLREFDVPAQSMTESRHRSALATLAARLVDAAEPYYASAMAGIGALPPRCAWAVATALHVYRAIGLKVRAKGAGAWDQRQGTSKAQKLWLLGRGLGSAGLARLASHPPRPAGLWQAPEQAL
jgi:15-cis-phytoene synthase